MAKAGEHLAPRQIPEGLAYQPEWFQGLRAEASVAALRERAGERPDRQEGPWLAEQ